MASGLQLRICAVKVLGHACGIYLSICLSGCLSVFISLSIEI